MAGRHARERTSLILTVLNEEDSIDPLLASIAGQTVAPDEVVVVDGGSIDATPSALERWSSRLPLRVLHAPGTNISQGRNRGVEAASGEVIAVTDGGVRLDSGWLAQLEAALAPEVDVVSGFFQADPRTAFEQALGATTLPTVGDIDPDQFLPSSRSVLFRRAAWQQVGGYPEWLDYGEDLLFDLALKRAGCRFAFASKAVAHFRPRKSLASFFRQYYQYARGDGKAGLWPRRHAIRYTVYAGLAAVLVRYRGLSWLLPVGVAAYTRRPYQRLDLTGLSMAERGQAIALVPVIRLVGDVAKMLGYPVGVWWRLRRVWTSRSSS
jgi:glycosyltransferase involved in cell wall biosynthesis